MRDLLRLILLLLSLGALCPEGRTQTSAPPDHTIVGTVRDQTGAVIGGATATLQSTDGTALATTTTGASGDFQFHVAHTGSYKLTIHQDGFQDSKLNLTVGANPRATARVTLSVATVEQQVTVGGDDSSTTVSSETAQNQDSNTLDRDALDRLPIFDQDYITLLSRFLDSDATGTNGVSLIVNGVEANGPGVTSSAIKSVKINQNPYSALYARPGRARIEIETKGGTPQFHGAVNFLYRDSIFDARNAFATLGPKPPERRTYVEGSLTGPLSLGQRNTFLLSVEDDHDNRQSNVSTSDGPNGPVNVNIPNPDHHDFFSGNVFHNWISGSQFSVSYSYEHQTMLNQNVGGTTLPEAGGNDASFEHEVNVTYSYIASPKLLNQLHFLVGYNEDSTRSISNAPGISVSGIFTGGGGQGNLHRTEGHFDGTDVVTYSHGKHELKFGIDVPDISRRGFEDLRLAQGSYSFASIPDYKAGKLDFATFQIGNGHVTFVERIVAGFAEDTIRFRPNLSVSVGLRYYWQHYFHDITSNLAPRLSFAYAPSAKSKTVFRAGAGLFYDRAGSRAISDLLLFDGQHLRKLIATNPTPPVFSYPITAAQLATLPPGIERLNPNARLPSSLQYSFGIERQITAKSTFAATYTGSRGMDLFRSIDVNAPLLNSIVRPDANFGQIRELQSEGYQKSNSLDLSFRGRPTKFFSGQARYSLGKTYNNTGGIGYFPASSYAPESDWSRSNNDRRHKFDLLGTFEAKKLFTFGLALAAYSGMPVNITTGSDDNHDGLTTDRPAGTPRNTYHGPGYLDFDMNLAHSFHLRPSAKEGPALTASLNAFNVFNFKNYTTYSGVLSTLGQAHQAQPPRRMQLNLEFTF